MCALSLKTLVEKNHCGEPQKAGSERSVRSVPLAPRGSPSALAARALSPPMLSSRVQLRNPHALLAETSPESAKQISPSSLVPPPISRARRSPGAWAASTVSPGKPPFRDLATSVTPPSALAQGVATSPAAPKIKPLHLAYKHQVGSRVTPFDDMAGPPTQLRPRRIE